MVDSPEPLKRPSRSFLRVLRKSQSSNASRCCSEESAATVDGAEVSAPAAGDGLARFRKATARGSRADGAAPDGLTPKAAIPVLKIPKTVPLYSLAAQKV